MTKKKKKKTKQLSVSNDESVGKLPPFLLLPLCFLPFTHTPGYHRSDWLAKYV